MSHKFGIPFSSVTALNTIQRYSADATSQKFFRNLMWCGLRAEQWTHKPRKKLSLPLYHIYILLCENRLSNTFFCGNTPTHLNFLYFEVWLPYKVYLEYWVMINGHTTFQQSKIVPKLVFQGCRTQRIVENYKLYYTTWKKHYKNKYQSRCHKSDIEVVAVVNFSEIQHSCFMVS